MITLKILIAFMLVNMNQTPEEFVDNDKSKSVKIEIENTKESREYVSIIYVKDKRLILLFHTGAYASMSVDEYKESDLENMIEESLYFYNKEHKTTLTIEEFKNKILKKD